MSCPYFYPIQSRGGTALFPLGDFWTGQCHADPAAPSSPPDHVVCNLGYARGRCARFPNGDGPDAVRFTISRDDSVYYVVERDHHPFAHGTLDAAAAGELLQRQGAAYFESYRRRVKAS